MNDAGEKLRIVKGLKDKPVYFLQTGCVKHCQNFVFL